MNSGDYRYIWQASDWPNWCFDLAVLASPMAEVSRAQGLLMGRLADVGMAVRDQASLAALTEDVVKTSEIEGERLDAASVRSSIARRLGVDIGALAPADRLEVEMNRFLEWVNAESGEPPLIKAGLAHLWFVTLHPFDDGNGRIARALGDRLLARADRSPQRFYSLSAQIQRERQAYYEILERTQKGTIDVTEWLAWFLATLHRAIDQAQRSLDAVLAKARFWQRFAGTPMNARQVKLLNRLLDGFEGKLTTRKWAAIAQCSQDTALRDIHELLAQGVLRKSEAGGRSTFYELNGTPPAFIFDGVTNSRSAGAVVGLKR